MTGLRKIENLILRTYHVPVWGERAKGQNWGIGLSNSKAVAKYPSCSDPVQDWTVPPLKITSKSKNPNFVRWVQEFDRCT